MASGVNFNPSSFQLPGQGGIRSQTRVQGEPSGAPSDGFQSSGVREQAPTQASVDPKNITLNVTPEQLTSAAFQQTLVTLQNSGFHVTLALQTAGTAEPAPAPPRSESGWQREVSGSLNRIESQVGFIADQVKPKPACSPNSSFGSQSGFRIAGRVAEGSGPGSDSGALPASSVGP